MKSRLPAFPSKNLGVWNEHNRYGSIISKYTTYWIDFDYNEEGYNKLIKYLE